MSCNKYLSLFSSSKSSLLYIVSIIKSIAYGEKKDKYFAQIKTNATKQNK